MFRAFKEMLFGEPVPTFAPVMTTAPLAAPVNTGSAPIDWVKSANDRLADMLRDSEVKRRIGPDSAVLVKMPVEQVTLGTVKLEESPFGGKERAMPHERVQLIIRLHDKAGNFLRESLSDAVHATLDKVPALAGHMHFARNESQLAETRGSIGAKLQPLLQGSGKFAKEELGQLGLYFNEEADRPTDWNERDSIDVSHKDGKVQVRLFTREVNGDEDVSRSGDQRVMDYIDKHHDVILATMKEKLKALGGMSEDELTHLDFHISISQREGDFKDGPLLEFGKRNDKGALEVTQLSTLDTDKVDSIITDALVYSNTNGTLSSVFDRFTDGPTVAKVIRSRITPLSPELAELLDAPMFQSKTEYEEKQRTDARENKVDVGNVHEDDKDPSVIKLSFDLPHGVSLDSLRAQLGEGATQAEPWAARVTSLQSSQAVLGA